MGKPHQQPQLTTNQKVVVWARGHMGKKIGRGDCWDLAEQSLEQAGAQTSNDLGPVGKDTDYIWGERINDVKDIEPGDILQLRDHLVTTTTDLFYTFPDESWERAFNAPFVARRPHHTAIVNGKLDADGAVIVLEQHVKPLGDIVQKHKLYTRDVPPVVTKTFEKRINPATKKVEMAKVIKTVKITVEGAIWAYKPKPK
jgi:hypothetical protein